MNVVSVTSFLKDLLHEELYSYYLKEFSSMLARHSGDLLQLQDHLSTQMNEVYTCKSGRQSDWSVVLNILINNNWPTVCS